MSTGCSRERVPYRRTSIIDAEFDTVWAFYDGVEELKTLTPDWLWLRVPEVEGPDGGEPDGCEVGTRTRLETRPFDLFRATRWVVAITEREVDGGSARVGDEQVGDSGPFEAYTHVHRFEDLGGETVLHDRIHYEGPVGTDLPVATPFLAGMLWHRQHSPFRSLFAPSPLSRGMNVFAVEGLPEIQPGDDLAALIAERVDLRADDVVCVASTVVSKAEGRQADLGEFPAGECAKRIARRIGDLAGERKDPRFAQAVLEESEELLLEHPIMLAVTHFGHVTVNAGIDRSNVPGADLLLLPEDPAASAERLRERLGARVIVADTSGRPFRYGQRGVALGWAGLPAARDWRGETDREGREMEATVQAVVDELAAAANLVTGEGGGGTPVAVVGGFEFGDHAGDDRLFRPDEDDLVRAALREWSHAGD